MSSELSSLKMHNVILDNRKKLSVSGVEDVNNFNDNEIIILTCRGTLILKGSNIKIVNFDVKSGELEASGDFYAAVYSDKETGKGMLKRLLK